MIPTEAEESARRHPIRLSPGETRYSTRCPLCAAEPTRRGSPEPAPIVEGEFLLPTPRNGSTAAARPGTFCSFKDRRSDLDQRQPFPYRCNPDQSSRAHEPSSPRHQPHGEGREGGSGDEPGCGSRKASKENGHANRLRVVRSRHALPAPSPDSGRARLGRGPPARGRDLVVRRRSSSSTGISSTDEDFRAR